MTNESFENIVNDNRLIQSSSLTIRLQYIQQINNEINNNNSNTNNYNYAKKDYINKNNNANINDNINSNDYNESNSMIELKLKPGLVKKMSRIIINSFLDNQYNESKFINEIKLFIQLSVKIFNDYDMIEFYANYLQEILNIEFKKNIYLLSSSSSNQERLIDLCCILLKIYCDTIITSFKQIHHIPTTTHNDNDDNDGNRSTKHSGDINGDSHAVDASNGLINEVTVPTYIQSLLVIIGEQFEKLSETLSTDICTTSGRKGDSRSDSKNDDKYENKYFKHAKNHIKSVFNHFKYLPSLYVLASQLWMNLPITITTIAPILISSTTSCPTINSTIIDQTPIIAININCNAYKQSQKTAISSLLLQYFKDHHHHYHHLDPLYIQLKSILLSTYKQRVLNLSKQQASILSHPCWNLFIKLLTTEDWSSSIAPPSTSTIAITSSTTDLTSIVNNNTISDNNIENLEAIFQKTIKKAPESFSTVLLRFLSALNPSINISNYIRSIGIITIIKLLKSSDDNIRHIALYLVQLICNRFVIDIDCYQQLLQQLCEGYLGNFDYFSLDKMLAKSCIKCVDLHQSLLQYNFL